ncbi:hypothetical protein BGX38DRAFT_1169776 [Terfezia claveryi]|nr:hypothetical protein BGX38DRAFT_1169776 [Terfezia claveryi]
MRAAPLAPQSSVKQKKFSWGLGEPQILNGWENAEKKTVKPFIAIPVPKKNRSVVNLQHGRNRASKGEDGNMKSRSKPLSEDDKDRRKRKREQRKVKEGKMKDLEGISEEGALATVEGKNPETTEKQSEKSLAVEPPGEGKEETPPAGVGESPEVKEGEETAPVEGIVAAPAVSTEDEAAKKERRKKRKEVKEAVEGKEGEKNPSKHHSTHKSTKDKDHYESSSRSVEKGKEKGRPKKHREEKHKDDKGKKDNLRRQNTEPITEKEKKEHKSRSKTAPVGSMRFDIEKDVEVRRKMKEKEAQAQQPPSSSLWSKKVLAMARFSMAGQNQEETRRKSGN